MFNQLKDLINNLKQINCISIVLLFLSLTTHLSFAQGHLSGSDYTFRAPSQYVKGFIENDSLHFDLERYGQFELYFKKNSYASNHLNRLKEELDLAMQRIKDVLSIDNYPYGIRLIAVDSKDAMEDLMGYNVKGGAAVGHDLVFFVFNNEIRPQFKHEIFHLMAYEAWGMYSNRLLDEGGATYTDGECLYQNPIKQITAYLQNQNMLFPISDMIENFEKTARENDLIAYLQAAAIFGYLYEKHNGQKMAELWEKGFDKFEEIYGITISQFNKEWSSYISKIEVTENIDWNMLMKRGCG